MNGNTKSNRKEEKARMAIPENKERLTITIHRESKALMDNLLALHDRSVKNYSQLLEVALVFYGKACMGEIDRLEKTENKGAN